MEGKVIVSRRHTSSSRKPSRADAGRVRPLVLACAALLATGVTAAVFGGITLSSWGAVRVPSPDAAADLLVLGCAGAGTLLSAWLGLGFACAALAALPGGIGAAFDLVAGRLTPAAVRRTVAVLLGTALSATLVPNPAGAVGAVAAGGRALTSWSGSAPDLVLRGAVTVVPGAPDPAFRPTTSHLSPSATASDTPPPPAPDPSFRPTLPGSPGATRDADRTAYTPAVPAPPSAPRVLGPLGRGPRPGTSVEEHVVVRRGDSLWHIAARYLGPHATSAEVAHEWPRWYAANRAVIGGDPDRIQPGQRLTPPTGGVR